MATFVQFQNPIFADSIVFLNYAKSPAFQHWKLEIVKEIVWDVYYALNSILKGHRMNSDSYSTIFLDIDERKSFQ